MRKLLDKLYLFAAVLAGICLIFMMLIILSQIVGRWFDIIVPSTEDFSGFLLAAASFVALPYALRSGSHIRVSLFITHLSKGSKRLNETIILVFALILSGYIAWSVSFMVYETWIFEELTQGYIAIPLWIPQLPMAVGGVLFSISILDELVLLIRTGTTEYLSHEALQGD